MNKFSEAMALLTTTAWVGGLWGIGYIAVPVLFQTLPDRMLAGLLAGKMFTLIAYIGIASACYLLPYYLIKSGKAALKQTAFRIIIIMLLFTIIVQFGIQPIMADLKAQALPADVMHSAFSDRFKMLHGVSSILYLTQSLLGAVLVLKTKGSC
jgi:Domain of unknown function (DUF4149)